jgi:hypothetical protein
MILTKEQIKEKKSQKITYTKLQAKDLEIDKHTEKYRFLKSKLQTHGQYFVYECLVETDKSIEITYPKLGIYTYAYICDQTLEIEWIDIRRTWEYKTEREHIYVDKNGKEFKHNNYVSEDRTELRSLILWWDDLLVYGSWDTLPNWKQLRQAYEKSWWFKREIDERRDIQIDRILKS